MGRSSSTRPERPLDDVTVLIYPAGASRFELSRTTDEPTPTVAGVTP